MSPSLKEASSLLLLSTGYSVRHVALLHLPSIEYSMNHVALLHQHRLGLRYDIIKSHREIQENKQDHIISILP